MPTLFIKISNKGRHSGDKDTHILIGEVTDNFFLQVCYLWLYLAQRILGSDQKCPPRMPRKRMC